MSAKHRTILYVDDDTDDQFLVYEAIIKLTPATHVITADNGLAALQYLNNIENNAALPCLIILDINMPLIDGKETIVRLRKEPRFNNIPIVLFSTSSSQLDQRFCEQYGIPFVTKPVTGKELCEVIENMLLLTSDSINPE